MSIVPLKPDGTLDIERINALPLDEWMDVMADLTSDQTEYYISHTPTVNEPIKAIAVDYTLVDKIMKGGVDAETFLKEMRKKYIE